MIPKERTPFSSTPDNIKRGLLRLWVVIATAFDVYLLSRLVMSLREGEPVWAGWIALILVALVLNVLWFAVLAALLWVLDGFFLEGKVAYTSTNILNCITA